MELCRSERRHVLFFGGARSGKTFLFVRNVIARAKRSPESRHVIWRYRFNHVRASVWLDTFPKVMKACHPDITATDNLRDGYVTLSNGAQIWFAGLDDKNRAEKVLGQEFATIYFNECSQIPYSSVLIALTRLAQKCEGLEQRAYYDCNPPGETHWTNRLFVLHQDPISRAHVPNPEDYCWSAMNPEDNRQNLDPAYLNSLKALPERHRRRFYEGVFQKEQDGALWSMAGLERARCSEADLPNMRRIVVAIDPSGSSGPEDKRSDEIGLVVVGLGVNGRSYLLADLSDRMGPEAWGRLACIAYREWRADRIVAEINFGGAMVAAVIRAADPMVPVKVVTASRGKAVRAEPVSALYERDLISHCGRWPALEDQLMDFTTAGFGGERSPDRADALIWAITELMLEGPRGRAPIVGGESV